MMRTTIAFLIALLLFSTPVSASVRDVYQDNAKGFSVLLSIESYDKTILCEQTTAFTFKEALQKLAEENGLELTLTQSGTSSKIYSVNSIQNSHFKGTDGWYGFIRRKDSILTPEDFLELTLEANDILTLYYGEPDKTKILSHFQMDVQNGTASFTASTEYTEWTPGSDGWIKNTSIRYIPDVKVHLLMPGGMQQILNTNENGFVSSSLTKLGIYKYYTESYVFNHVPNIVKTPDSYFLYGVKDKNRLTRGEAAAFIVNAYNPEQGLREISLTDVDTSTAYYEEIGKAVSAGLVSGYEDGTFRSEETVTLLQFCLMMSGLYPISTEPEKIPGVPSWACEPVSRLLESGILLGVPLNWDEPVGEAALMKIYGA